MSELPRRGVWIMENKQEQADENISNILAKPKNEEIGKKILEELP